MEVEGALNRAGKPGLHLSCVAVLGDLGLVSDSLVPWILSVKWATYHGDPDSEASCVLVHPTGFLAYSYVRLYTHQVLSGPSLGSRQPSRH